MARPKHHNWDYDGGVPDLPFFVGDRWYGQDIVRDFQFLEDLAGRTVTDFVSALPVLTKGGSCVKGTGDSLNITAAAGYHLKTIKVPNSYASIPPTVTTAEKIVRVESTAQTNMAIPSAVLDSVTVNYVKLEYAEVNSVTRNRAKKAGSYNYEKTASFLITVDNVAPTSGQILLATFTGPSGGPYVFVKKWPSITSHEEARRFSNT